MNCIIEDSRQSYRQIAKKASISVVTVMNHVKELDKQGVIKAYTAGIDYEKLGYDIDVIVSIKVSKGKLFEVENKLATVSNVITVFDVTGDFDCMLIAKFKNRRALDGFLKKIQTYDFIERTSTVMILNTIKNNQMRI